jgi:hypothetical protein
MADRHPNHPEPGPKRRILMKTRKKYAAGCVGALTLVSVLAGCGEEKDHASNVHTLRVLAVRSETPFAKPARSVRLDMLAFDASPRAILADGSRRATSTLWLSGCVNPSGDSYLACMPYLRGVVELLGDDNLAHGTVPPDALGGSVGWGESFVAEVPGDIISSRGVAAGVVHPYGVEMVFFAKCGGILRRINSDQSRFPLGCFDATTGLELDRDDFEFGYYPLFSYESIENQNPQLNAISFDGKDAGGSCSDAEPCPDGSHCGTEGVCLPIVERCTQSDADDCASHVVSIDVPASSVERAVVAHVTEAEAPTESLWVSYYGNGGSFEQGSRTINDPQSGWNSDMSGKWRAKVDSSREVRLWAVVRDNRYGVAWGWRDVWVE